MRQRRNLLAILKLVGALLFGCYLLLAPFPVQSAVYALSFALPPTPTPIPTPSPDARLGFSGNLLVAIATIVAAVAAAIIAGIFGIIYIRYQARKNKELEQENLRIQQEKQDIQHRLDLAQDYQRNEDDLEKSRYNEWLIARRDAQERERQRKLKARTETRSIMVQAHTLAEREEAYRKAIHTDTNISQLLILDMAHPMEVAKVYVRVRLHQDTKLAYEIDSTLLTLEKQGDPNALVKANFKFLEAQVQSAMTPEEALQKYPRCVVLGDPGAGKSTLLKYLTLQSVDRQLPNLPHIPIHIVLGDFAASVHQDLIGFAAERWDEWYGFPEEEARSYIESHLDKGNAILLLDALDETIIGVSDEVAKDSYKRVLEAIDRIARRYAKVPIVITARKAGYYRRAHISGFTELEVLDFRPEEIKEFVDNWFRHHPAPPKHATADALNLQLTNNPRLQSLATNPLLLCLIMMVYESRQDLPEKRAEIYKQCIDVLLLRWDTSRDIRRRRRFRTEHKQQLLAEIAWHFHIQGRRYFPEDELLAVIANFMPTVNLSSEDNKAILSEIEEENGLLKAQAHDWHGFIHLTLQEYFVSQYLSSRNDGLDELLKHCGDPWWEEVTTLYAGSIPDASLLLQKLLKMEKKHRFWKDIYYTSLLAAGQCLAAKPRLVQRTLGNEVVIGLFDALKKTPYSSMRRRIAKTLLEIEGYDAKTKLHFMLKDKQDSSTVRVGIAGALGELGDQRVVPELLAVLKDKNDDSEVRWNIARALGQLGDQRVVPELLAVLKDKQDSSTVRDDVAIALGQLGDQTVVPELLAVFKDKNDDSEVRGYIASALGELGDQRVVPELLATLKDKNDDSEVRWAIASALGQLGDQRVVPELLAILKDKQDNSNVRDDVARALGQLGDQRVIPELLVVLKDKQDNSAVHINAAKALIKLGQHALVLPYLHNMIKRFSNFSSIENFNDFIWNYESLCICANLLKRDTYQIDNIYQSLWEACQREKVNILMFEFMNLRFVRVVRQG